MPGNGDGTLQPPVQYNPAPQPIGWLATADFNGDGIPDLAFTEPVTQSPTEVGVMLGNADGTMQSPRVYAAGDSPHSPALADLNGDGTFRPAVNYMIGTNAASVAVGI